MRSPFLGLVQASIAFVALAALTGLHDAAAQDGAAPARPATAQASVSYQEWFTDEAMRIDLFHAGATLDDAYSLDEVVWEPVWPGTRVHLIDPFKFGSYRFRVRDAASGKELFSQGYATLFDEWTGTDEAKAGVRRSMSESVRFPWPRKPVLVQIDRRDKKTGVFQQMYELVVDPASHQISRARPFSSFEVVDLNAGPAPEKAMDVLIVAEGYSPDDRAKLRADLKRFAGLFLDYEPWKSNRERIHIRGIEALSLESGVSEPRKGLFRDSILGSSFNTFDSERYLTVMHTKRLRQIASLAPYDTLFVMANSGRYGGGGVYNQWSVFVSDNEYDDYVMLHEFGHHMGGLADEYYDSAISNDEDLMYPPGVEPWEPNISAFLGKSRHAIKWKDLILASTSIPSAEQSAPEDQVGLFEGAGYKAKGLFRPQKDCKMFHKGLVGFCKVCSRSLVSMLHYYTGEEVKP
ncbi:MAG: hypothetical protein HY898_20785 [Deltaproteobacteria bacterium]|nr:hypothetical protein [Deltaproteobacteria bacterium]